MMQPAYCPVDYTCELVEYQGLQEGQSEPVSCSDLTFDFEFDDGADDGKLTFAPTISDFENGLYPPGDYLITIQGKSRHDNNANADLETVQVTMTLKDPCENVQVTEPVIADKTITLTSASTTHDFTSYWVF